MFDALRTLRAFRDFITLESQTDYSPIILLRAQESPSSRNRRGGVKITIP
jgi:hypothetical protein